MFGIRVGLTFYFSLSRAGIALEADYRTNGSAAAASRAPPARREPRIAIKNIFFTSRQAPQQGRARPRSGVWLRLRWRFDPFRAAVARTQGTAAGAWFFRKTILASATWY
jgi:hypothetical protein